jgi:capsular polysaccharide transport system permease protein
MNLLSAWVSNVVGFTTGKGSADLTLRPDGNLIAAERLNQTQNFGVAYRLRSAWYWVLFLVVVIAPTVIMAVYTVGLKSPEYTSEFRVIVRSPNTSGNGGFAAVLGLSGTSATSADSQAVVQYLQSREAIDDLEDRIGIRKRFSGKDIDVLSRTNPDDTIESFVRYWNRISKIWYESTTGTVVAQFSAFSPADAITIAMESLKLSEELINRMSERARSDVVEASQREVGAAEARLLDVNSRLRQLREAKSTFDPKLTAEADLTLMASLEQQIAQLNARLSVQLNSLQANAPTVKDIRQQIDGLEQELKKIRINMTSIEGSGSLFQLMADFDQLYSEKSFAEKSYQSALASLEAARVEAARKQLYLATIVRPEVAQEASSPKPLKELSLLFLVCFFVWAALMFTLRSILEHI